MAIRETLQEAGYEYAGYCPEFGAHGLRDKETGRVELWAANKNHAGYAIRWRNTDLEFVSGSPPGFMRRGRATAQ